MEKLHCCLTVLQNMWVEWGRMSLSHVQLLQERERKKRPVTILFSDYFSAKADEKITLHFNCMLFDN